MKRSSLAVVTAVLLAGCGQQSVPSQAPSSVATLPASIIAGPTATIARPPAFTRATARAVGIRAQSAAEDAALANEEALFGKAQTVVPIEVWNPRSGAQAPATGPANLHATATVGQQDGYSLLFTDFYGASFAYVNNVARDGVTDPGVLTARHDPNATPPEDTTTWTNATYVTGANTRRTPISAAMQGFPILYGLYSQASRDAGFDPANLTQLVMPSDTEFWAKTSDGRYFDLMNRVWLTDDQVGSAKSRYDQMVADTNNSSSQQSYATSTWQKFHNTFNVKPSPCPDGASACIDDPGPVAASLPGGVQAQSVVSYSQCRTRWFLWWSWQECGTYESGTRSDGQWPKQDYQKLLNDNTYWGCGPASGAAMLWWWKQYGGVDTMAASTYPSWLAVSDRYKYGDPYFQSYTTDDAYENTAKQLVNDMGAFSKIWGIIPLPQQQRATWPWNYTSGLNNYLRARGVNNLTAQGIWGYAPFVWQSIQANLRTHFQNASNEPIVGLYVGANVQHLFVVKGYRKEAFGDLWVQLQRPLGSITELNLSAWWVPVSGAYWIQKN